MKEKIFAVLLFLSVVIFGITTLSYALLRTSGVTRGIGSHDRSFVTRSL